MADNRLNIILGAKDEASKTVATVQGRFAQFKKDAVTGFGLGAGISVFNMATRAIGGVVDIFGDAVRAAAEEQVGIAQLDAALEANIEGWDGNREAIEALITEREKLAFNDDEQRQSLALLVAATKDVTEAQKLQAIAMDLSRLRGTELVETTTLMAKVYSGNLTALKRFGISLGDVKNSTEALAKIQQLARGQAEAYAETLAGKQERATQALNNAMEDLGNVLTPLAANLADFAADAIPELAKWVGNLADAFNNLNRAINPHIALQQDTIEVAEKVATSLGLDVKALRAVIEQRQKAAAAAEEAAKAEQAALQPYRDAYIEVTTLGGSIEGMAALLAEEVGITEEAATSILKYANTADEAAKYLQDWRKETVSVTGATEEMTEAEKLARDAANELVLQQFRLSEMGAPVVSAVGSITGALDDMAPAVNRATESIIEGLADLPPSIKETIAAGKDDVREAMTDLRWAMEHPFAGDRYVKYLEKKQKAAQKLLEKAMAEGKTAAAAKARAIVNAIEAELDKLEQTRTVTIQIDYHGRKTGSIGTHPIDDEYAAGGYAAPGRTYLVGERGPELLRMGSQGGTVAPSAASGFGPITVNVDGYQLFQILDRRMGDRYSLSAAGAFYRSTL